MRRFLTTAGLLVLAACSSNPATELGPATANDAGRQAYTDFCAGCHETGMFGAPIAGDSDYWRERSPMWQAVLMQHAREGFYDMPAKGSRPELSDATINRATEYMLGITYPDYPGDPR
jgi:cytochrome c5